MTFSSITKMFSSDRTLDNGKLNPSFEQLQEYDEMNTPFVDSLYPPVPPSRTILDMNKEELVEFAQGMYGLKLHRKMSPSNMVKAIYEFMHNEVPAMETIEDLVKPKRKAGRPKGSKNKPKGVKSDPLIDNI